jgi:two-component system, OmpR family, sensor histidine kinase MtrB
MIPALRGFAGWLVHRWRGSLQIRIAATTLVLSAIVSALLGVVLLQQIRNGLVDGKTRAAIAQLNFGLQHAADQFAAVARPDPVTVSNTARTIVSDLGPRGNDVSSYGVVLVPTDPGEDAFNAPHDDNVSAIPAALRRTVSNQGREAWTYSHVTDETGQSTPALAVGAPVPNGSASYQLYYLFPLGQEEQTLALVQRTMLFAGAALVLLLVAIAALVTRQVVGPVRQAAATAERLAAGRLRDRMIVRGEDDLASLATSFNRMAETVETQISQLRELSRVQRRFVADVSHELRTPITTIRMAADVLHDSRTDLTPELARSSELLQMQLDRFEALLADLLEISRYDAGAAALEPEAVDLRGLVERVVDLTEPIAQRRESRVDVDLPPEPVVVDVDTRRIERVLRNLVVNAVEHGAGRPVHVRLAAGPGGVAVSVRDHGAGLRPGEAALVFGRFWRADPARARTSGGSGLGLSIALEDARLHAGWLQAWGEPGQGCVFRLTLPWRVGGEISESPLPLDPTEADDVPADGAARELDVHPTTEPADV